MVVVARALRKEPVELVVGVKGLADWLLVGERTVGRWIASRRLPGTAGFGFPAKRIGGRWVAAPAELDAWTDRREAEGWS